jgi:ferritin-like metal-binding protein YciE
LKALGGSTSGFKSFLAHLFGALPKSAQIGHEPEERAVQDLMMAFSVENAEVAMYESLIAASDAAGDRETGSLARQIQRQEQETAHKLWPHISPAAAKAFGQITARKSEGARELVLRYLQDVEAAEENFEDALAAFSKMGDQQEVKELLSFMSRKARSQHERLRKRIETLGGTRSVTKSILAHMLAFTPTSAQIGQDASEKNTQHLMITCAAAAAEMAMYESLAAVAESAGDRETLALARELQREEEEDHRLASRQLSQSASAAYHEARRA